MKLKIGKLKLKRAGHLAYPLTVGKLTVAIAIDVFCLTALLQRQLMYSCWLAGYYIAFGHRGNIYSAYITRTNMLGS